VTLRGGRCTLEEQGRIRSVSQAPLEVLRDALNRFRLRAKTSIPFLAGAVGFCAYDFGFSLERIARRHATVTAAPELSFAFYDTVFIKDNVTGGFFVFSSGFPETSALRRRRRAKERLAHALKKLERCPAPRDTAVGSLRGPLLSNFTPGRYKAAVRAAKEFIAAGDIYQVNVAQRFCAAARFDPWGLYRRLSRRFPVSFGAFLRDKDYAVLSVSPERFLKVDGRRVVTRPMKGTRPRTARPGANRRLYRELARDKKEKAELLMIVDLERNDLGRVCDYGSVRVDCLRTIERYASVYQATAQISGRLHPSKDRIDALRACFPGGSVTGCPKIRAMEVIEELEPEGRGIYTGALGYLSFHDTMELSVLIRTLLWQRDRVSFHVGSGIVTDSRPAFEYDETLVKAAALIAALEG
jgi:para-aminobenzoate synthetase component 1